MPNSAEAKRTAHTFWTVQRQQTRCLCNSVLIGTRLTSSAQKPPGPVLESRGEFGRFTMHPTSEDGIELELIITFGGAGEAGGGTRKRAALLSTAAQQAH